MAPRIDNPESGSDEEISLKGPGGIGFSFKGAQMFPVILVLLLGSIFAYLFWQSESKADERNKTSAQI